MWMWTACMQKRSLISFECTEDYFFVEPNSERWVFPGPYDQNIDTRLKFLESGRDGACAVGDGVALARHELALDVGDVHEQLLPGILKRRGE